MKLLTRTVRNYVIFSALLLLVSTPLFYFAIQQLFVHQMDRELLSHKREFYELVPMLKNEDDLKLFGLMNDEFLLKENGYPIQVDSLITMDIYNEKAGDLQPYRVLQTGVNIQGKSYVLQIQESMVNTTDLVSAIVIIQVTLITVLLIGLILINRKLSKTIWDPFYTILDKLRKYQIDKDTSIELPQSATAEFRDLSATVSQLVNTSHGVFQSQKEFTENASHELQTPLAVIRSKIDMLMQTPLSEKQAELIHVMQDAAGRMARLNRNLLLLAKSENHQFLEREQVNLVLLVEKLLDQFREQVEQKGLRVEISQSKVLNLMANRTSMEVLLTNLLTNAIRYAPPKSIIHILFGENSFSVSNAGEPLVNPEKIFDRFQHTRSSNGSGIGLAIVKEICDSNGFKAQYQFKNSMHLFTIDFVK